MDSALVPEKLLLKLSIEEELHDLNELLGSVARL